MLDSGSSGTPYSYTFNPANAEQQNIDSNADAGPIEVAAGDDAGASAEAGDDGGAEAGDLSGQAAGGTLTLQGGSAGLSTSESCSLCANGLLAAKLVGVVAAFATGTGAATAACALVGIPTAEVGGVACHLIVGALGLASQIPSGFTAREGLCNEISNGILGMAPVCASVNNQGAPIGN